MATSVGMASGAKTPAAARKAPRPVMHHSCTVLRRMLIRHSTVSLSTGVRTEGREEWVTKECGIPLFSEKECASGICRSCAKGWTSPNNFPVTSDP